MTKLKAIFITSILALGASSIAQAQNIVEDGGVGLTYDELEYMVGRWTPQMQKAAASDTGDRLELLNVALANKRVALEADKLTPEEDPQAYWDYVFMIRAAKRSFVVEQVVENLAVPDMSELAAERYETEKEKYARIPERRISSHILFACAPGACSRKDALAKAQPVLDQLRAGADFVEMVQQYSEDPGTKKKDGKFDKWMKLGETQVAGPYSEGLFEISEIGEYSELVQTQFGVHIIRLDGIEEEHYEPFDKVKAQIIADLELEYKKLAMKEWLAQYNISNDAYIDGEAMEKLFSKYRDTQ